VRFTRYARDMDLLEGIRDRWAVQRLQAFTKGFYTVDERGEGKVVISDLRMGQAGFYAFAFTVGARRGDTTAQVTVQRYDYGRPPLAVVARDLLACGRGRTPEVLTC
jgi:inner membrane protein